MAVLSSVGSHNGKNKSFNQDAFLVEPVHAAPGSSPATLIGVFDGHGTQGHVLSSHVASVVREHVSVAARQALASSSDSSSSSDCSCSPSESGDTWWEAGNLCSASALAVEARMDLTPDTAQECLGQTFSRTAELVAAAEAR